MMPYTPPFMITEEILNLAAEISELLGNIESDSIYVDTKSIRLRKENRIRTIHSTLAIENNSLTLEQITAIVEGKRVIGSLNEIHEVKNAIEVYEKLLSFNPYSEKDLLNAHKIMMADLVSENGRYRTGGVGIINKNNIVHLPPPASQVPKLMGDLFEWLNTAGIHPLIKSCVFHYEFEFIHPFQDGNGRMGRLWQTVILKEFKQIFAWLPVETLIKDNQKEYYSVLGKCDAQANSTAFIKFMLEIILNALKVFDKKTLSIVENNSSCDNVKDNVNDNVKLSENQKLILNLLKKDKFITQAYIAKKMDITLANVNRNIKKLKELGLLERKGSDKSGYWVVKSY